MKTLHTRLIMDSGKEYIIEKHPEDLIASYENQMGVIVNKFFHYKGLIAINPAHISSIEGIEVEIED
ncbi:hypothetical protein [Metabacillus halosaccharovorans]|uniref:hypothetical protein n=1 Tax=Metabacillus halosaccharovorans TaxID=930124 RepID=UPI001C1F8F57|nr:hypothetical protein [Metabacillus halosaccharovorans]MBU7593548.1 hypothetical protein [Metabacillus halosaccharovorans]